MEYTTLGSTGTEVSRIRLGCMSFGSSDWREWVPDEGECRQIIDRAIDLGINFFDIKQWGGGRQVNERVQELADDYDLTMAQVALAWLFHKDWVDAPIVGTTSVEHIEDAVESLDIPLDDSDAEWFEEPYEPVPVSGHD